VTRDSSALEISAVDLCFLEDGPLTTGRDSEVVVHGGVNAFRLLVLSITIRYTYGFSEPVDTYVKKLNSVQSNR